MARVSTSISGVSTTSEYKDGETSLCVNLRPKNGAMIPAPAPSIISQLSQSYDNVFIHKVDDIDTWIGTIYDISSNISSVYYDINGTPVLIQGNISGKINSVQQIGNTVSLITSSGVYYLIKDGAGGYTYLGQLPEIPPVIFSSEVGAGALSYFPASSVPFPVTNDNAEAFKTTIKGLANQATQTILNRDGASLFDTHFIRYAFRLYDGSLTKHSPPILVMPSTTNIVGTGKDESTNTGVDAGTGYSNPMTSVSTISSGSYFSSDSYVHALPYSILAEYDFTSISDNWGDIIQSVDFFLSAPLGVNTIENIRKTVNVANSSGSSATIWAPIVGITPENIVSIETNANFYFLQSIPLTSPSPDPTGTNTLTQFPSAASSVSNINDIIYQERMTDDPMSHNIVGADTSYVYNGSLILASTHTALFNGFDYKCFLWDSAYNGVSQAGITPNSTILIITELEISGKIEQVYSLVSADAARTMFLSGMISYPDSRAKKMSFYLGAGSGSLYYPMNKFNLKAHDFLNLAYYLSPDLSPIAPSRNSTTLPPIGIIFNAETVINNSNAVKVSDINNPFSFPTANNYEIGNGSILALASQAMNISDRNFGQWPIYAFTTTGIWAMIVGSGEVSFSNIALVYSDPVTSPVVCETPHGVFFASHKGLMSINNLGVKLASSKIQQNPRSFNWDKKSELPFSPDSRRFPDILPAMTNMVFNPYEDEVVIVIPFSNTPNWVYNIPAEETCQTTQNISTVVKNSFPSVYVVDGTSIRDYAKPENTAEITFISRALLYGTPDLKKISRIILRGDLTTRGTTKLICSASNDGYNFFAARGKSIPQNISPLKDIDLGLFARMKNKYFSLAFTGALDKGSIIYGFEAIVDKEYSNDKMR